ncbi:unannotated protein [freshwater metagenome]|uniref:Unannotated protein n=1 Tax=freshwater metagenome TaxID=449393 RepID=A0A6J7BN39_9ZZZZ|nr:hypothetical protein [Actinomycetota bacterium]MSW37074.1 hypothetical protein [Actinomycetota bacterium]MSX37806.1 hypothetical protein [Actinomycetota bacterium]
MTGVSLLGTTRGLTDSVASLTPVVSWPWPLLSMVITVIALVIAAVCAVLAVMKKSTPMVVLALVGILEAAIAVLAIAMVLEWGSAQGPAEPFVYLGYLLMCLATPPAMVWWARGEPGRWGSGVLAVAGLMLPVLLLRLQQVWTGRA